MTQSWRCTSILASPNGCWGKPLQQPKYKASEDLSDSHTKDFESTALVKMVNLCEYSGTHWDIWAVTLDADFAFLSSPDLSPGALLLMFMSPLWQLSQALPVRAESPVSDQCVSQAQMFQRSITETLSQVGRENEAIMHLVVLKVKTTSLAASKDRAVRWVQLHKAEHGVLREWDGDDVHTDGTTFNFY